MKILETKRLILRTWSKKDAGRLFEICSDRKVMKHIGNGKPYKNLHEAGQFLIRAENYQTENGFCRWCVVESSTGVTVGSCGLLRIPETREIELGYLFARDYWRLGFATEAARDCLNYGFGNLGFREIIAINCEHSASQNVLTKIGFVERGIEVYDNRKTRVYSVRNI